MPGVSIEVAISTTSNGPVLLVAGVTNQHIVISNFWLQATTATTFQLKSAANILFGPLSLGILGDLTESNKITLNSGEALNLTQTGAAQLSGRLTYSYEWDSGYP